MSQVSRPVQIALGVTVLFLLVWFVALRPKPATEGDVAPEPAPAAQTAPAAPGTEGLTGAIDEARDAVTTANEDAERAGQTGAEPEAVDRTSAGAADANTDRRGGTVGENGAARNAQARQLRAAIRQDKAVAVAFIDPHTADSGAVGAELRAVSRFDGRAVTLVVPLADLADYGFITRRVAVTVAPTVVVVDRKQRASTIVGFTDRVEIEQRLADAVAVKPAR